MMQHGLFLRFIIIINYTCSSIYNNAKEKGLTWSPQFPNILTKARIGSKWRIKQRRHCQVIVLLKVEKLSKRESQVTQKVRRGRKRKSIWKTCQRKN